MNIYSSNISLQPGGRVWQMRLPDAVCEDGSAHQPATVHADTLGSQLRMTLCAGI